MRDVRGTSIAEPAWARRLRIVLLVMLAGSVAIFMWSIHARPQGEQIPWIDQGLYDLAFPLAAGLAFLRSRVAVSSRSGWLLIAVALAVYGLGNITWTIIASNAGEEQASLADLFWVAFVPLMLVGLVLIARRKREVLGERMWLDALVVGAGAFGLGISIINGFLAGSTLTYTPSLVINTIYVLGDLLFIGLAAALAQAAGWRLSPTWWLLLSGFVVFAVADSAYLVLSAIDQYSEGSVLDAGWMISALLFGIAATTRQRENPLTPSQARIRLIAPTMAIVCAAVLGILPGYGPLAWVVKLACLATVLLGVVRMGVAVRDGANLADQLRRAEVDPLTGLMSRRGLQRLPWAQVVDCGLIALDIDGTREVNDSLGHTAGDRLIQVVAERLNDGIRDDDLIARLGSDEFAIVIRGVTEEQLLSIAESLVQRLEQPLSVQGVPLHVSACAGVARIDRDAGDIGVALSRADVALNSAKSEGVGIVRAFAGTSGERSVERLRMRAELKAAMVAGGDDFTVVYQPITRISDDSVWAVEALVRWNIGGSLLPPGEFLDELTRAGIVDELTALMATKSMRELRAAGLDYPVTINVPPHLLTDHLVLLAERAIAETGSASHQMVVEITEDALIRDPEQAQSVIGELRERGIRVLVDDFGAGYSGLSMLRDYLVDGLKIDYSYVSRLGVDPGSEAIVRAARAIAHELDLLVIYEGAETDDVVRALAEVDGCLQGFAIARPMQIAELIAWSQARRD